MLASKTFTELESNFFDKKGDSVRPKCNMQLRSYGDRNIAQQVLEACSDCEYDKSLCRERLEDTL